ncbi:MAG: AbrB family transcriptional regulator [Verrucomicrobiales bacterium]|jgi:membrane AbrB-like protein|nr:AbrB family transcriptional regulator [Verrucomicrobiales bacterium]
MRLNPRLFLLLGASVALALVFRALHLPAAWFFAPFVAAAVFAVKGWQVVKLPRPYYLVAQAMIGTALGAGFSPSTLKQLPEHWVIFAFAVVFILLTSLLNGWILTRCTKLDAATSFLGTMPGGAGEMTVMSESLRADTRLVTVMQFARLLLILGSLIVLTPVLQHFFQRPATTQESIPLAIEAVFNWQNAGILALLAFAGWCAGMWTRIPAGTFLVPTLFYFLIRVEGVYPGRWPAPVFAVAYVIMGLQVGGRFDRATFEMIKGIALPVCGTTLLLLTGSFALALILAYKMNLDPVSAYLAATPGGMDSVAAVANELHGDTAVILAVHLVRLLCVLIVGPWLVRGGEKWFGKGVVELSGSGN